MVSEHPFEPVVKRVVKQTLDLAMPQVKETLDKMAACITKLRSQLAAKTAECERLQAEVERLSKAEGGPSGE